MRRAGADIAAVDPGTAAGMLVLAAAPLLATTSRFDSAAACAVVLLATLLPSALILSLLRAAMDDALRLPLSAAVTAACATLAGLLLQAWDLGLYDRSALSLQLLAMSPLLLAHAEISSTRVPPGPALAAALRCGALVAGALLGLGALRELLAGRLLLVELAPGGFFLLAITVALLQMIEARRPPPAIDTAERRVRVTAPARASAASEPDPS